LPLDDGSGQVRLEFNPELTFLEPNHKCDRCGKFPEVASVRMPQGPMRPVVCSHFTTVRDPRDLPSNDYEWAEIQEHDPEHSAIARLAMDEVSRIVEQGYFINDNGVI
jgi:hypothetical protein